MISISKLVDYLTETDLPHVYQTKGYDCGPTCIKMIGNATIPGFSYSIDEITELCGSDPVTGTDDKKMARGLTKVGISFKIGNSKSANDLAGVLAHSYAVVRTLTRGVKHWIVAYRYSNGLFSVNDPWLGRIKYTPEEIVSIWKPRDFFYLEIPRV